jgi:hypothetical protein
MLPNPPPPPPTTPVIVPVRQVRAPANGTKPDEREQSRGEQSPGEQSRGEQSPGEQSRGEQSPGEQSPETYPHHER